MAKTWGGAGAWAAEAERVEAEENERRATAMAGGVENAAEFPPLSDAVSTKPKKKKGQTLSLAQLHVGQNVGHGAGTRGGGVSEAKGLTVDEMIVLPTGPRERTAEEASYGRGGLGGGFRDYGRTNRFENKDRGERGGFGSEGFKSGYGGFDDDRRQNQQDRDMPSRADESDNWGNMKKPLPPVDQSERRRYNEDRVEGSSGSRADDNDNWGAAKKFVPSAAPQPVSDRRFSGFGSGFRDPVSDSDRWRRESSRDDRPTERPRIFLNPPRNASEPGLSSVVENDAPKPARANPFGSARPREDVLAEKNIDIRKFDNDFETRDDNKYPSRPSSSHSSVPPSPDSKSEVAAKPRPKVNPFGDAKPREHILAQRGEDYLKKDFELEHRHVDRPETEDEINLKKEINALKDDLAKQAGSELIVNGNALEGDQLTLTEVILKKEKELEVLVRELDDKVRFVKRGGDRPGSAAGRSFDSFDRPRSQSGRPDSANSFESFGRPRSRGGEGRGPDVWRSGEERRGMFGNRDRSFNNRERYDSRRW